MTVEIKELVIRATTSVDPEPDDQSSGTSEGDLDRARIIEECVREVLKVLRRSEER